MQARKNISRILCEALLTLCVCGVVTFGQEPTIPKTNDSDILKINTELVQTGITVFDKQGRFVDGLIKQDFDLRVDGRPVSIAFFESILAGSDRDRLARTMRGEEPATVKESVTLRQRTIIFFVDDRHLSLDSNNRTRKLLTNFIDKEMGPNDLVAIASASGQIGFLQQFTDNKDVLHASVGRLNHLANTITDFGSNTGAPMTEYLALTIEKRDDPNVSQFFVEDCMKWAPKVRNSQPGTGSRAHCEIEIQNRARQILLQAGSVTSATYYSLETLLHSAERMPGSKLAFFISDGFLADTGPRGPIASNRLGRITDQARRAGVVIYSIDARGLVSGLATAEGAVPSDPNGRLESANLREIPASQDALNALAADTGGRALRNQPYFDNFVNEALTETSRYYLLAWRPEPNEAQKEIKKIDVSVIGHPELTVRFAHTFISISNQAENEPSSNEPKKETARNAKKPSGDLQQALEDFYPKRTLPLLLSLIYLDTPANGTVLTSSIQASGQFLSYGENDKEQAQLSIAGVILNDHGKTAATFRTGLSIKPSASNNGVIYNYPAPLKPGIYQVRVAARDDRSGKVGSAMQWVVVPDLSTGQLLLSSLILGLENVPNVGGEAARIQWSIDRTFARNSHVSFMTFIYNAKSTSNELRARVQVFKDAQSVVTSPLKTVALNKQPDPARVPFKGEISLAGLPTGRYILEVTVEDQASQKLASQSTTFFVE